MLAGMLSGGFTGGMIGTGVGAAVGGVADVLRAGRRGGSVSVDDDMAMAGSSEDGSASNLAQRAVVLARQVSAKTGIAADLLWSQWAHETGGFKHVAAANNLAGINVPGGRGADYRSFSSLEEFGDYYAHLMRPGGRYSGIQNATSPSEFAARLKSGGYYSDTQSNYTAGMDRWDRRYGDVSHSVTIGSISVSIDRPGASPEEVQRRVTLGVADAMGAQVQRNLNEFAGSYAG